MQYVLRSVFVVLAIAILFPNQSQAQGPTGGQANQGMVAVVDVAQVFKNHARFKQKMDAMKAEVDQFGQKLNDERQQLVKMKDRLQTFVPGSLEYKRQEEDLARQVSDLDVSANLKRKDMMEQEAKIYFETYQEVVREIAKIADSQGISLVLNFTGEALDARNPNAVLATVNRAIVYQKNLDITPTLIQRFGATDSGQPNNQATRPFGPTNNGNRFPPR